MGVGSMECRQGEGAGNKISRSLFELCQWSVQTAYDLGSYGAEYTLGSEGSETSICVTARNRVELEQTTGA